jgi:uncharacterized alkaline shock family protein YloU
MDGAQSNNGSTAQRPAPRRNGAPLSVAHSVVVDMVRVAALEVPGVLRVGRGSPLRRLAGSPVRARFADGRVSVRVWIIARPNHPLAPLAGQVRHSVAGTIERLLNLEVGEITVVIDGVGAS